MTQMRDCSYLVFEVFFSTLTISLILQLGLRETDHSMLCSLIEKTIHYSAQFSRGITV